MIMIGLSCAVAAMVLQQVLSVLEREGNDTQIHAQIRERQLRRFRVHKPVILCLVDALYHLYFCVLLSFAGLVIILV
jgi:hypothetical protein